MRFVADHGALQRSPDAGGGTLLMVFDDQLHMLTTRGDWQDVYSY